jgi:hypothetical protein
MNTIRPGVQRAAAPERFAIVRFLPKRKKDAVEMQPMEEIFC